MPHRDAEDTAPANLVRSPDPPLCLNIVKVWSYRIHLDQVKEVEPAALRGYDVVRVHERVLGVLQDEGLGLVEWAQGKTMKLPAHQRSDQIARFGATVLVQSLRMMMLEIQNCLGRGSHVLHEWGTPSRISFVPLHL